MENPSSAHGEHAQSVEEDRDVEDTSYDGFAEAISALQKLNRLESDIASLISECKVPLRETRKFLRCSTADQVSNVSLFQFMKALFMQMGIDVEIADVKPFSYVCSVKNSPIMSLYSGSHGRTCVLVSEAIARFFQRDLNLGCHVEEIRCQNDGDVACEFEVRIEREDFCRVILNTDERKLLEDLRSDAKVDLLSVISDDQMDFRLDLLRRLDLIGEDWEVTDLGSKCSPAEMEEEDIDPPWKNVSQISTAISSALSFAEATHLSFDSESEDESQQVTPAERKEVKEYRSFAELLAKQVDKESKSEGF